MSSGKSNPLFVDSTKYHGDRIGAQIELNNICLREGEQTVLRLTDHLGQQHRLVMQVEKPGATVTRAWLNHQKQITLQFTVELHGEVIFAMAPQQTKATYAVVESWRPVPLFIAMAKPQDVAKALSRSTPERSHLSSQPWVADYGSTVESLIDKWGL